MAKSKADRDDDKPADGHAETPPNTTVKGKTPESADDEGATVKGGTPKGTTHYPPSPSDSAGEKTDNIAPSRLLPPDVPESENPPPRKDVPTVAQALAQADAETARLRAENEQLRKQIRDMGGIVQGEPAARGAAGPRPTKRARVTPAGGSPMEVEIPADTPDERRDEAAVEAWKRRAGIWSVPAQPHVEHDIVESAPAEDAADDETTARRSRKKS